MISKEKANALLDNAVNSHSWLFIVQLLRELIVDLPNEEKIDEEYEKGPTLYNTEEEREAALIKKNQEMIDNLKLSQT